MKRISATLPAWLDGEWQRFNRSGGSGTDYVRDLAERARRADAARADAARWMVAAQDPDLQRLRADYQREAADFEAEREAHDRERAGWVAEQQSADEALQLTLGQVAEASATLDVLRAAVSDVVAALADAAAKAARDEIARRAELLSYQLRASRMLDNPAILAALADAAADAASFYGKALGQPQSVPRSHRGDLRG